MRKILTIIVLCALPLLASEDPKLRQKANELSNHSFPASTPTQWPPHHSAVQFTYTNPEGATTEGTYTVDYQKPGIRRKEVFFGGFHSLVVYGPGNSGESKTQDLDPPGVRELEKLTPVYLIRFDHEDVINDVRSETVQGRPAQCVDFVTSYGSQTRQGEVCYDQAIGTLVHFQVGGQVIESSNWVQFAGIWLPTHVEETEDGRRVMIVEQTFSAVESFPASTFILPPGSLPYQWCSDWRRPTGLRMPQPKAGPGDNVDDILVQVSIDENGNAFNPEIRESKRPDLDAEALTVATQWKYRPATCDGKPHTSYGDLMLHFKGR